MAWVAFAIAGGLIVALGGVMWIALRYVRRHPELVTHGTPLAYQLCQNTLRQVIERNQAIAQHVSAQTLFAWQAPNGYMYTVSGQGVEERRESGRAEYSLNWAEIGGIGVRMQPGFRIYDYDRDGRADRRVTTGYSFHVLIVPLTGTTIIIPIPINNRADAVDFVAHTLALADHMKKRINVFGFDRPPAPRRQRVPKV